MVLVNGELERLYSFLLSLNLSGKDSWTRTRFCRLIGGRIKEIQDAKREIIMRYAEKDEDGNPKVKRVTQQGKSKDVWDMSEENTKIADEEFVILMSEEFVIDETEERKSMLLNVKEVLINANVDLKGDDAIMHGRWCDIFSETYK